MDIGRRYAQQRYSLISQGCTVIHLPRVKFKYVNDDDDDDDDGDDDDVDDDDDDEYVGLAPC